MREIYLCFILTLLILSCSKNNNGISNDYDDYKIENIFSLSVNRIKLDYPYLYVAAWTDGLWRIRIDQEATIPEKIVLPDSIDGISRISDVAPFGSDIIISSWTSIYQSLDNGISWDKKTNGIPYVQDLHSIERFPTAPEKIIILQSKYIYWSDNNAISWNRSTYSLPITSSSYFLKLNPNVEGVVWVNGMTDFYDPVLVCLSDFGKNFNFEVNLYDLPGFDYLTFVQDLLFDVNKGEKAYMIGGSYPKVFESFNNGLTWFSVATDSLYLGSLSQNRNNPNIFYVADGKNIYASNDSLRTFSRISTLDLPDEEENIIHQIIFEHINQRLIIATYSGVYILSKLN